MVRLPASNATLTDVLHEARTMRDEAVARLVAKAWHAVTGTLGKLLHTRVRPPGAVRLAD